MGVAVRVQRWVRVRVAMRVLGWRVAVRVWVQRRVPVLPVPTHEVCFGRGVLWVTGRPTPPFCG